MKINVGRVDKSIRITLGFFIIALGIFFQSWWGLVGIIPLFTGLINWCPLYNLFGFTTCHTKENN